MIARLSPIPGGLRTTLRVVGGLAAVLLVAGTLVYLHLFKLVSFIAAAGSVRWKLARSARSSCSLR